jgi:16S rRNA (cytidine1402-2'-O)-methyltransferase
MSTAKATGTLYLMPVWLGDHGGTEQLPPVNIAIARGITLWYCEQERTARRMLRRMDPAFDLNAIELHRLDQETTATEAVEMLRPVIAGRDGAIISEAGMPGIADPGALLVQVAHQHDVPVVPLIGPSSLFLALAASGLNGQRFSFHGYLPVKPHDRKQAVKRIEGDALRTGAAQLFIETPYRNDALLADLLSTCAPDTLLCIATDVTQPEGTVRTQRIAAWRKHPVTIGKRPTVFVLGRR